MYNGEFWMWESRFSLRLWEGQAVLTLDLGATCCSSAFCFTEIDTYCIHHLAWQPSTACSTEIITEQFHTELKCSLRHRKSQRFRTWYCQFCINAIPWIHLKWWHVFLLFCLFNGSKYLELQWFPWDSILQSCMIYEFFQSLLLKTV